MGGDQKVCRYLDGHRVLAVDIQQSTHVPGNGKAGGPGAEVDGPVKNI